MLRGLSCFLVKPLLPDNEAQMQVLLNSQPIKGIRSFALGPEGTNIQQACDAWKDRMGIVRKHEIVLCDTPEQSVEFARLVNEDGVVPVFWTCAVFVRENEIFFNNPDTSPFLFEQVMPLDQMQLCTTRDLLSKVLEVLPSGWRVASHPSPAPLIKGTGNQVVLADSNASAAIMVAQGKAEACITTESARRIHGLCQLHSFGSSEMVFFGGTTRHGLDALHRAYAYRS